LILFATGAKRNTNYNLTQGQKPVMICYFTKKALTT